MTAHAARVWLHPAHAAGPVDPRLFGGFLEHMGRAVYGGIYDPGSPLADAEGFRTDVLAALAELGLTVVRYPGGNFVSGYHWRDGVGPRERRPRVRELAWNAIETNAFGTDEFLRLCERMGWTPMLAVNLGTGTPEEARDWVEYCNAPAGTRVADERVANGRREPYRVPLWCLGNEMDGPWQLGHTDAQGYAERARAAGQLMKLVDPSIELVACGSCAPEMPTYLEWDRIVLERLTEPILPGFRPIADHLSTHRYVRRGSETLHDYLAVGLDVERQIDALDAVCRLVRARRRTRRRVTIAFDEWNVWYRTFRREHMDGGGREAPPLLEEVYDAADALVVAGFLHAFLRRADAVRIANIAQIVNVIAPVLARPEGCLRQTIFDPFALFARSARGVSLRIGYEGPTYGSLYGDGVPMADLSATLDGERLALFATNRSDALELELAVVLGGRRFERVEEAFLLEPPSPDASNAWDDPDRVRARPERACAEARGDLLRVRLPRLGFAAIRARIG